jgi:hypothetical protein
VQRQLLPGLIVKTQDRVGAQKRPTHCCLCVVCQRSLVIAGWSQSPFPGEIRALSTALEFCVTLLIRIDADLLAYSIPHFLGNVAFLPKKLFILVKFVPAEQTPICFQQLESTQFVNPEARREEKVYNINI